MESSLFFKIGLWLLFADGTDRLIDRLIKENKNVFLDYKMFDIPETVKEGVARARDRGIKFVTVHGNPEIMSAAVAGKDKDERLKIFAITVLTSMDDDDLQEMGYSITVRELIELRVRKALECRCDGIIASARDRPDEIRRLFNSPGLLIATPGIRRPGKPVHDHKRSTTPTEAIRDGADYLVVGRDITEEADPASAALDIIRQMEEGQRDRDMLASVA
jgi:orotidine-5'-phosphate decarboxylase